MKINLYLAILIFLAFNICIAEEKSQSSSAKLQTKISLIAIDPGFGGNESGPIGCDGTVQAKKINLQITEKISDKVRSELGIDVLARYLSWSRIFVLKKISRGHKFI